MNTKVRPTQARRGKLASPVWGRVTMNSCNNEKRVFRVMTNKERLFIVLANKRRSLHNTWSLRQSRRHVANRGSRQPLNTWAIRIT